MSATHPAFLGFAEEFRTPGSPTIAPDRFASAMHLQVQDLAQLAGVHRATISDSPGNARLQGYLRESLRVLSAALGVTGDHDRAAYWFRNVPIPEFRHRTAAELVSKGHTDAVLDYLASVGPDAPFYRALTPRWAYQPESGAGAAVKGGRFNRPGVEARYLAESAALALIEYQAESALLPPATFARTNT